MSNPHGRRSSFKNPHVQEELLHLVPQDVFRGSYSEFNLTNMTRLSGNSVRGSLPKRTGSGIPTPSLRRGPGPSSSVKRNVTYADARSKSKSTTNVNKGGGSALQSKVSSIPRSGSANNLARNAQSLSRGNVSVLNNTRRRSRSHDTLSLLQTPAFTPARSRSKSPGALSTNRASWRRGVQNEGGDIGKNITITKDRKQLAEMAKFVYSFLESQDCQARPAEWKDLVNPAKISVAKFMAMIKFLASHFVGDSYFLKTNKADDDAEKVMELFKILKYPGTLPKSHLKTPTVQHAWPGCFTFLAWLTARTNALLNPPSEKSNIEELNTGLQEFAFESYLSLFPLHFRKELWPEQIDAEMENFRDRVRESHATELTKTKEELIDERTERQAELERLNAEVDPSKEVKERLAAENEVYKTLLVKINEAETFCKKYSDINHLKLQNERILMEINSRTAELTRLKNQISCQPLSKQEASEMQNETTALKNQLDTIRHVNANLEKECESRRKKLEACQKEFYELCKKFDFVEKYNENLRFLKLDEYLISTNPFAPAELEEWMKEVATTLRRAQARVNDVVKEVIRSSEQKEKENQEFRNHMMKLENETKELEHKIKSVQNYSGFIAQEQEKQLLQEQSKLDEVNAELLLEEEKLAKARSNNEDAKENLRTWEASFKDYQETAEEWSKKLEEATAGQVAFVNEMKQFVQNMITKAAQEQQEFYLTHFGFDIFENLGETNPDVQKKLQKKK